MAQFRIATFNVNSVRSRMPVLSRWLPGSGVDILAIQETKTIDDTFPLADLQTLGYTAVFRGEKSYNGVAILSKKQPDEVIYGFADGQEPACETRFIRARFGKLWLWNTYVPQGKAIDHPDYQYKKQFLNRISALLADHVQDDLLWVGDLNVAAAPLDVTNPGDKTNHVCFVQELRDLYASICVDRVIDLLRIYHAGEALYSFFDYRVKNAMARNIGWRIDAMLATKSLAAKCRNCWIDKEPRGWEKPSDHTPMCADFEL